MNRFIQIHFLTSYSAALLNRDDAGFAKRIPFGSAPRIRISSQCLKRHWRRSDDGEALSRIKDTQPAVRSRLSFERFVRKPLITGDGIDPVIADAVTEALMARVLGESNRRKAEKKKQAESESDSSSGLQTNQVTILGMSELAFLHSEARAICAGLKDPKAAAGAVDHHLTKERIENLRALKVGAGLDAAMFGRMVTGDILARTDAALHVAHAFTVHAEQSESDYFSAVDDLLQDSPDGGLGSGHINSAELTSGLFYGYVVIDVPGLCANLSKDAGLAREVTRRMVHLIATVSPGAKLGSTAPHSYASLMLVEAASQQPRSLANAFLVPVRTAPDLLANSYDSLAAHLSELDRVYGRTVRHAIILGPGERLASVIAADEIANSLASLAAWTAEQVECPDA